MSFGNHASVYVCMCVLIDLQKLNIKYKNNKKRYTKKNIIFVVVAEMHYLYRDRNWPRSVE